jgi:uncharacterized protein
MATILLSIVILLLVFAGMAVGVLMGRQPIKGGTCGGLSGNGASCEICGGNPAACVEAESGPIRSQGRVLQSFDPKNPN